MGDEGDGDWLSWQRVNCERNVVARGENTAAVSQRRVGDKKAGLVYASRANGGLDSINRVDIYLNEADEISNVAEHAAGERRGVAFGAHGGQAIDVILARLRTHPQVVSAEPVKEKEAGNHLSPHNLSVQTKFTTHRNLRPLCCLSQCIACGPCQTNQLI